MLRPSGCLFSLNEVFKRNITSTFLLHFFPDFFRKSVCIHEVYCLNASVYSGVESEQSDQRGSGHNPCINGGTPPWNAPGSSGLHRELSARACAGRSYTFQWVTRPSKLFYEPNIPLLGCPKSLLLWAVSRWLAGSRACSGWPRLISTSFASLPRPAHPSTPPPPSYQQAEGGKTAGCGSGKDIFKVSPSKKQTVSSLAWFIFIVIIAWSEDLILIDAQNKVNFFCGDFLKWSYWQHKCKHSFMLVISSCIKSTPRRRWNSSMWCDCCCGGGA